MLSVPFALVGGLWHLWWLSFNLSVAVAVGFIALAGVAAEAGVVILIYLDHALVESKARCKAKGRRFIREDLREAIMSGAVERRDYRHMLIKPVISDAAGAASVQNVNC